MSQQSHVYVIKPKGRLLSNEQTHSLVVFVQGLFSQDSRKQPIKDAFTGNTLSALNDEDAWTEHATGLASSKPGPSMLKIRQSDHI